MTANVTAKEFVRDAGAAARREDVLDGAADVRLGIDKSAVDVEQINREWRNHFMRSAAALLRWAAALSGLRAPFEHTGKPPRRLRLDHLLRPVTARGGRRRRRH